MRLRKGADEVDDVPDDCEASTRLEQMGVARVTAAGTKEVIFAERLVLSCHGLKLA